MPYQIQMVQWMQDALASGKIKPGSVVDVDVIHEKTCPMHSGKNGCTCTKPEFRLREYQC